MKLKITVIIEQEIRDLSDYAAETLKDAASNQQTWFDDGTCDIGELLVNSPDAVVLVEGIE